MKTYEMSMVRIKSVKKWGIIPHTDFMGERGKKLTFLDYWEANRDMMRFSMYTWLDYYDKEAYEQTLASGKTLILDHVEDVANELENTGEKHLAETTRAGGLFVHLSAFVEKQKGLAYIYDLGMYKDFLGKVSKTIDEESSAKDSLIVVQGVLQDRLDGVLDRILPDRGSSGTSTQE